MDGPTPRDDYLITSTTVSVIGKTKTIQLLAFPSLHIERTVLGIDYLSAKSIKANPVSPLPQTKQVPKQTKPRNNDIQKHPTDISLMDWILDYKFETPLYNILTEETATDQDIYAICAFMKNPLGCSRPVSPIRSTPRAPRTPPLHSGNPIVNSKVVNKSYSSCGVRRDVHDVTSTTKN